MTRKFSSSCPGSRSSSPIDSYPNGNLSLPLSLSLPLLSLSLQVWLLYYLAGWKRHLYLSFSLLFPFLSPSLTINIVFPHSKGLNSSPTHLTVTETDLNSRFNMEQKRPAQKNQTLPKSASLQIVSPSVTHVMPVTNCHVAAQDDCQLYAKTLPHSSPKGSPILNAKKFFRLSGSHLISSLSPTTSPRGSPTPNRRKFLSPGSSMESEYMFWWMENTPERETRHWKQVLKNDGKWIYFWHVIRPNLKPAHWLVCTLQ